MCSIIELLSDETINQIAAGEVVEGPASVVKELVENALDAGAHSIRVQIVGGGLQSIVVVDDGKGMTPDDANLSVVRHATSKIRKAQDLFHISSMGFRGEALASIASVSKMTIHTSQVSMGTQLEFERGKVISTKKSLRGKGTTVTVRQLFYNVPARKKFQKGPPALSAEVLKVMIGFCLGHPEVQFEFISNGRKTIRTRKGETLKERISGVLGQSFCEGSLPVEFERESLHFRGVIGSPTMSRPNRKAQHLFINRRAVTCDAVPDAVRKGYGTRLDERRYPLFLLHLDVPANLVDVNVHPQKLHVRLRKEELFRETVCEAVERALSQKQTPSKTVLFEPTSMDFDKTSLVFRENPTEEQPSLPVEKAKIEVIGVFDCFILYRDEESLSFVSVEAASFRVLFDEVCGKLDSGSLKQGLLIPLTIDLTPIESAMILTHRKAIEDVGFTLSPVGKDVVMVEALPSFLSEAKVESTLSEIAVTLQTFIGKLDYEKERREALALILASKSKAKSVNSHEEAERLLDRLSKCESPTHCPKGENVRIQFNAETIESMFRAHQTTSRFS